MRQATRLAFLSSLGLLLAISVFAADTRRRIGPTGGPPTQPEVRNSAIVGESLNVTTQTITAFDTQCSAGENCLLWVFLGHRGSRTGISCTFDGNALTPTVPALDDGQGNANVWNALFAGITGQGDLVCTWATARPNCLAAVSLAGVNQTAPDGGGRDQDKGNGRTSVSTDLTLQDAANLSITATNRVFVTGSLTLNPTAGQTVLHNQSFGDRLTCAVATQRAAGTVTISYDWTGTEQVMQNQWGLAP